MSSQEEFTQALRAWTQVFMHRSLRDFKRFMDQSGLSVSQVNTLMRLYHGGACGISDIGDHLGVTHAASSQMVDRLVGQGLLVRTEDPNDRRGKQITLTGKGRTLVEQGIEARALWMEELNTALTPQEKQDVIRALTLLTDAARQIEN